MNNVNTPIRDDPVYAGNPFGVSQSTEWNHQPYQRPPLEI